MNKASVKGWKEKAIARRHEIVRLKKHVNELKTSRNNWKLKYQSLHSEKVSLHNDKAAGHQYPVSMVWLCIHLYRSCRCSLRNCSEVIAGVALIMQISCRKPSTASVRNWIIKYGYYCYEGSENSYCGKWAVIVDESVSIGQERLLLVLGLCLDTWRFDRAIAHQDVRVLHVSIARSWKSEQIAGVLKAVSCNIEVSYCVSDKGNNIMGALKELGWLHIYDCSHQWAKLMEHLYEDTPDFRGLMEQLGLLRKRWVLSRYSHLMPPQLRSKSRFMNIFPLVKWIEDIRMHWFKLEEDAKGSLVFLQTYELIIDELIVLKQSVTQMAELLKTKGMSRATLKKCACFLAPCKQGRPVAFKKQLQAAWHNYKSLITNGSKHFLCCSDIIESYFGRFKERIRSNAMQPLTESVLMMAGWGGELTKQKVKTAMSQVSIQQIHDWKNNNTAPSLLKKRRDFFNKKCTKKSPAV